MEHKKVTSPKFTQIVPGKTDSTPALSDFRVSPLNYCALPLSQTTEYLSKPQRGSIYSCFIPYMELNMAGEIYFSNIKFGVTMCERASKGAAEKLHILTFNIV